MHPLQSLEQIRLPFTSSGSVLRLIAPFEILLIDQRFQTSFDKNSQLKILINSVESLMREITLVRILDERWLDGEEIKWIRQMVGLTQRSVSRSISMTPEHLSRCESMSMYLSDSSEKMLRLFFLKTVSYNADSKKNVLREDIAQTMHQIFEQMRSKRHSGELTKLGYSFLFRGVQNSLGKASKHGNGTWLNVPHVDFVAGDHPSSR